MVAHFNPSFLRKGSKYKSKLKGTAGERLFNQTSSTTKEKKGKKSRVFDLRIHSSVEQKVGKISSEIMQPDTLKKKNEIGAAENELVKECTFSTSLVSKSQKVASKNSETVVYDRLYSNAKQQEEKLDSMRKAVEDNSACQNAHFLQIFRRHRPEKMRRTWAQSQNKQHLQVRGFMPLVKALMKRRMENEGAKHSPDAKTKTFTTSI